MPHTAAAATGTPVALPTDKELVLKVIPMPDDKLNELHPKLRKKSK